MEVSRTIRWRSVGFGWLVAVLITILISPLIRWLYDVLAGSTVTSGKFSSGLLTVALVSGFLAYLFGGFVAGRLAGISGGANGAMTAAVGTVVSASLGALDGGAGGIWSAILDLGFVGTALLIGLLLFATDLFGGYIGGKLGEPSKPGVQRFDD